MGAKYLSHLLRGDLAGQIDVKHRPHTSKMWSKRPENVYKNPCTASQEARESFPDLRWGKAKGCWKFRRPQKWPGCASWSHGNRRRTFLACYFYWPIMRMREKPRAAIRCYCLPLVYSSTTTISQYAKMKIFCLAHYSKANYILIQFMKLEWSVC